MEKVSDYLKKNLIWIILLGSAAIRFAGLVRRDFWYDEAFTGIAVKESFSNMLQMINNDVHPPLYYILLKMFASFFHYSVFGIRIFSAIFGVAGVFAVYLFAKKLFNEKVGLWASFITAISPFAIQYSQEARMYSMFAFLIVMAAYFFVSGLESEKKKYFIWFGVFLALAMLTHYMGIIFSATFIMAGICWKYFLLEKREDLTFLEKCKKVGDPRRYGNIFLGYLVALVIFLPWIGNFKHHLLDVKGNLTWVKPASFGDIISTMEMFFVGTPLGEMSSGMPQPNEVAFFSGIISHLSIRMVLAVFLGATFIWLLGKERKGKLAILVVFSAGFMFVVYLLSLFSTKDHPNEYFVARYLLAASFFFYVYLGLAFSNLKANFSIGALAAYFLMINFTIHLANSTGYTVFVKHLDKYQGNHFYILNSFDYVITKYYLDADNLTLYNYDWPEYNPSDPISYWAAIGSNLKRTEEFSDLRDDPRALIISNKNLIGKSNQYFDADGLELVDQYNNIGIYRFAR